MRIGASNETGPALNNNTATDVDSVGNANLRISKDDGVGVVAPGQTMTYSIVYRNVATTTTATNVVITETPPLAVVSPLNTAGWTQVGNEFTRNLGSMAPGMTSTLTFAVQTLNGDADGTLVTNTVHIRADNDDVNQLADNVASDTDVVRVSGAPDLRITGASVVGLAVAGHPVAIVVTVTNAGPVATSLGFFSDVYADRAPVDRNDLGDSRADSGGILGAGQSRQINLAWTFATPGVHQLNFQVDTCDPLYCLNPSYGRVAESNEANNMFGPLIVDESAGGTFVYLPLLRR